MVFNWPSNPVCKLCVTNSSLWYDSPDCDIVIWDYEGTALITEGENEIKWTLLISLWDYANIFNCNGRYFWELYRSPNGEPNPAEWERINEDIK